MKPPPASAGDARDMGSIPGQEDPLEEEMAIYSSVLAWGIPWIEEPGGLQSMGSKRVGHNSLNVCIHAQLHPTLKSILFAHIHKKISKLP